MAAVLFGFEDLLYSWDSLVWSLTSRALRTCRFGNLRVLQLMLKPWCISRAVYQVGLQNTKPNLQPPVLQRGNPTGSLTRSCPVPTIHLGICHRCWQRGDTIDRGCLGKPQVWGWGDLLCLNTAPNSPCHGAERSKWMKIKVHCYIPFHWALDSEMQSTWAVLYPPAGSVAAQE